MNKKINWKHQYKLDNSFNVVILVLTGFGMLYSFEELAYVCIAIGLYINISAAKFFYSGEYE